MRRLRLLTLVVVVAIASSACRYLEHEFDDYVRTVNIVYGDAINEDGQPEELLLDLYTPPAEDTVSNRPVLIWAHGGGFTHGDKVGFTNWVVTPPGAATSRRRSTTAWTRTAVRSRFRSTSTSGSASAGRSPT